MEKRSASKSERKFQKLTQRYCFYQITNFMASAGLFGFAVTYLLERGFSPAMAGTIMAVCSFLNCGIQPVLGDLVDRINRFVYPKIMMCFYGCSVACMLIVLLAPLPMFLAGILFMLSCLFVMLNTSVNNSLCVYYTTHGVMIDYSLGIGIGSLSYSLGSLGFGYLMAICGVDWMLWLSIGFLLVAIVVLKGYPEVNETENLRGRSDSDTATNSVSLPAFMMKYRLYMVAVVGVMMVAICHTMAENFMIKIFEGVGGNSENVGIALFVACMTAAPIQILFEKIQNKIDIAILMKLGGFFYIIKPLLLVMVSGSGQVYLIQLMQTITYGLLYPSLFYFARRSIPFQDQSKAQAIVTAFYALGVAFGNLIGGRLIDVCGLRWMLVAASGFAFAGFLIICCTVRRRPA